MRTDIYRDPKVCLMADHLMNPESLLNKFVNQNMQCDMVVTRNVTRCATVGATLATWGVMRHRGKRRGDDLFCAGATLWTIDDISDIPGFGAAMESVGWVIDDPEGLIFPNFFAEYNVEVDTKGKGTAAERQKRYRERQKKKSNGERDVTRGATGDGREEERREELKKRENENGEQGQPYIPEKMNTPECLKAFEDWCDYLDAAGLDSINPRYNGPQAEAVWKQAHRFGPEKWPLCVQFSIANAYKSIVEPAEPITKTRGKAVKPKPDQDPEFLKTLEAYRRWPDASDEHRQARARHLGDTLLSIAKRIGGDRFVAVTEYTLPRLAAEFSRLKDEVGNEPF